MTIREQLEKEMDKQEIEEMEEENADNKECNKMDDFDTDINLDSAWSYPNQRALDSRRQCGFSVFNGYIVLVCSKQNQGIYGSCKRGNFKGEIWNIKKSVMPMKRSGTA